MLYAKCPRCGVNIALDKEKYLSGQEQKLNCTCGTKMFIKKPTAFKDILITTGRITGKILKVGCKLIKKAEYGYSEADERLERRGIGEWEEQRLRDELKSPHDFWEQTIISSRLRELQSDDETGWDN